MPSTPDRPPARFIAVGVVVNERGEYLLCRMPEGRGVFPGEWGLPGGGIPGGEEISLYMVFLLFRCIADEGEVRLNPEFDATAWVPRDGIARYRLNRATAATFSRLGLI